MDMDIHTGEATNGGSDKNTVSDIYTCSDFKDIAKCFATLHTQLTGDIVRIQDRVKETEKKICQIEGSVEFVHGEIRDIHEKTVPNLETRIQQVDDERLKLELWGRKWNLVIRGIEGILRESTDNTETKVRDFFIATLKVDQEKVEKMIFQAIHRIPSGEENMKAVIVRFVSLRDRDLVLHHAIKYLTRGCGFSVITDLPKVLATRRYSLIQERRAMEETERRQTKIVYLHESPFIALQRKK